MGQGNGASFTLSIDSTGGAASSWNASFILSIDSAGAPTSSRNYGCRAYQKWLRSTSSTDGSWYSGCCHVIAMGK